MRFVLAVLLVLGLIAPAPAGRYPCDLPPAPSMCFGMKRMSAAYNGPAISVFNPFTQTPADISFAPFSDDLNNSTLDTLLGGNQGLVTRWYGQVGVGVTLDQIASLAPLIGTLNVGNSRGIIFQGGSNIGMIYGLQTGDFSALGYNITAKDYTVIAVVKPSMSMPYNQASAPDIHDGALFDLSAGLPFSVMGDVTAGNNVVTNVPSTAGIAVDDAIQAGGVGISPGTFVQSIDGPSSITISQPALNSGTFFTLFTRPTLQTPNFMAANLTSGLTTLTNVVASWLAPGDFLVPWGLGLDTTVQSLTPTSITDANSNVTGRTQVQVSRPVARLKVSSNGADRGGWQASDGQGFTFTAPDSYIQTNPTVVAVTSNASGVKLYQNGQVTSTASRSALTRTASVLTLGKLGASAPGGISHAFDGMVVALIVYNTGLSQADVAFVTSALQTHYNIDPKVSTFDTNLVMLYGDSIAAGFKTLGIYGFLDYLRDTVSQPARFLQMAVPGSTLTPAGIGPIYASSIGLFPTTGANMLRTTDAVKGRVVIIEGGANDAGLGPPPRVGTTHSSTLIDGIADTSDLNVNDYVHAICTPLAQIQSKTASSITLTAPATCSTVSHLYFTFASVSPAYIAAKRLELTNAALAAGATKVINTTILPQNAVVRPWLAAVTAQINMGIAGSTVVDCSVVSGLNTNPGPSYSDSGHLSALGHQQYAACLLDAVNSGLSP
jgi:lysophospholipase L1-like esterase